MTKPGGSTCAGLRVFQSTAREMVRHLPASLILHSSIQAQHSLDYRQFLPSSWREESVTFTLREGEHWSLPIRPYTLHREADLAGRGFGLPPGFSFSGSRFIRAIQQSTR
jgi:hypothetical protein